MKSVQVLSASMALMTPFCAFTAPTAASDFRIELKLTNANGAPASFPVRCLEGCDWTEKTIDCPQGGHVCRAVIEGRSHTQPSQRRPKEVRAISGMVCVGIATTSLQLALSDGLRREVPGITRGSVVATVIAGSPAEQAGFKPGDLVRMFNGAPVERSQDVLDVTQKMVPNQPFEFVVDRNGEAVRLKGDLGMWTTAQTCVPADARVMQSAVTMAELELEPQPFKLLVDTPNWRLFAKCTDGCTWSEAGLPEVVSAGQVFLRRRPVEIDHHQLRPGIIDSADEIPIEPAASK